jgi:hypothetical protein
MTLLQLKYIAIYRDGRRGRNDQRGGKAALYRAAQLDIASTQE